jgi:hypothetical protein
LCANEAIGSSGTDVLTAQYQFGRRQPGAEQPADLRIRLIPAAPGGEPHGTNLVGKDGAMSEPTAPGTGRDQLPWWAWVGVALLGAVNVAVVVAALLR